jgi:NADH:ubiquinone reductase (H+-translocating)
MSESLVPSRPQGGRRQVVIIGGGFAGIAAAKALRYCEADVTIIDRRNHHIFQPLLYQVATAVLAPADVAAPIRQLAARQKNVSVLLAEVIGVDLASRTVEIKYPGAGEKRVAFDYLVVAAGVQSSYFGHNEFAKYAPALQRVAFSRYPSKKALVGYEQIVLRRVLPCQV